MVMEYLPVQVRLVRRIEIAYAYRADAGNRKIDRDRRAETAGACDKHRRVL